MSDPCASMGVVAKMLVETGDSTAVFDASSERYALLAENLKAKRILQGRNRITGDLSTYAANVRQHSYLVQGTVVLQPGPADLVNWLPRIMGLAGSGNTYGLGNTFSDFAILFHKENAIFRIDNCRVNYAVFQSRSAEGEEAEELVTLALNIYGTAEEIDGEAWPDPEPALVLTTPYLPYTHWEGVFTLGGDATGFRRFALAVNNNLKPIFYSSITPNCFRSRGRRVTLQTENPFLTTTIDDAEGMLTAGMAGVLTFTNGLVSTQFSMPHLRNSYESPSIAGKDEIPLQLDMEAFATAVNNELVVTNDSVA
jgi:hypothetical protein